MVDILLDANFPFVNKIIAYADDLVLLTWFYVLEIVCLNLQSMTDHAISWGAAVKLTFNAAKTYTCFSLADAGINQTSYYLSM